MVYTLSAGSVSFESMPAASSKRLPRHPVPVILLARLAVDRQVHGQGLGEFLLLDAFHRCLGFSAELGVHAVEVQAIDEKAKSFYEKYGFSALTDDPRHLFITIAKLAKAESGSSGTGA
jgi:GNAT superfamily N-acetyltransferase